jgi:excisionase family DNA binding protein
MSTKLLLSRTEAANALSLSTRTIDKLISSGQINSTRVGRAVRVHIEELDKFARRGTLTTGG